ncbi:hypothetical protein, variant [Fonticula alba]|uniref:Tetratricopeptide repeat protein n=1 Tax=Fonticula alba TaxID=691883 RepID=A0A058Z311_FONAL|nr:hypothetical protein, variant [Fonticula alba]KCV68481.1 hypothetical protein, variant [Fonticula alba]|eukprot:XP_009496913.1 hypothetical protein, variant [Fonticula alba]
MPMPLAKTDFDDRSIGRGFQPLIEEAVVGLLTATAAGAPVLATLPPGRPSYAAPPESPAPAPAPAPARGILSLRSAELAQQVVAKLAAFRRQALEAELRQTATGAPVGSALPACGGSAIHQALAPLVARDPVLRVLEAVRDRPPPQVDLLLELVDWTPAGQWIPDVWELSSREAILAETLRLRGLGNALFQAGRFGPAAAVYHHALCFMDLHFSSLFSSSGASRAHASSADGRAAGAESPGPAECPAFLQRTLRLNHAACSLKLNRPLEALSQLNRVLAPQPGECPAAGPKQRAGCDTCHPAHRANSPDGVYCTQDRTEPQFRKARYRRAQAHFALGAYDDALADLSKIPGPEASGLEKQIHRAMKRNRGMFS